MAFTTAEVDSYSSRVLIVAIRVNHHRHEQHRTFPSVNAQAGTEISPRKKTTRMLPDTRTSTHQIPAIPAYFVVLGGGV